MDTNDVKSDAISSKIRGEQLWSIMTDAAQNVLERFETKRGPYVIDDSNLKIDSRQSVES